MIAFHFVIRTVMKTFPIDSSSVLEAFRVGLCFARSPQALSLSPTLPPLSESLLLLRLTILVSGIGKGERTLKVFTYCLLLDRYVSDGILPQPQRQQLQRR